MDRPRRGCATSAASVSDPVAAAKGLVQRAPKYRAMEWQVHYSSGGRRRAGSLFFVTTLFKRLPFTGECAMVRGCGAQSPAGNRGPFTYPRTQGRGGAGPVLQKNL